MRLTEYHFLKLIFSWENSLNFTSNTYCCPFIHESCIDYSLHVNPLAITYYFTFYLQDLKIQNSILYSLFIADSDTLINNFTKKYIACRCPKKCKSSKQRMFISNMLDHPELIYAVKEKQYMYFWWITHVWILVIIFLASSMPPSTLININ